MKEVLKKMKIKCSKKLKKTHLSDGAYNLLIEAYCTIRLINQSYNMCIFCGLCSYDSIKSIGDWIPAHFNYWNSNVNQI